MEIETELRREEREKRVTESAKKNLDEADFVLHQHGISTYLMQRRDGRSMHHSWIVFVPYHIMVAGDVGNAVFSVSDTNSLLWLLTSNERSYVLSKMDPRHRQFIFYRTEALARIVEEITENDAERSAAQEEWETDEANGENFDTSEYDEREEKLEEIKEAIEDEDRDPSMEWSRQWWEQFSDEAPDCEGPDDEMLWLFEVLMKFRQLYQERDAKKTVKNKQAIQNSRLLLHQSSNDLDKAMTRNDVVAALALVKQAVQLLNLSLESE